MEKSDLFKFLEKRAKKLMKSNLDEEEKKMYLKYFSMMYNNE